MDILSEEKRKQDRIKQYSFLRINDKLALLIDISLNGMRIASQEVPDDPDVEIKISIEGKEFKLDGVIRWINSKNNFSGLHSLGIYIEKPSPIYKKLISKLLK